MLYELTLAFTLTFGGMQPTTYQFDINPTFQVEGSVPLNAFMPSSEKRAGFALPHLIFTDSQVITRYNTLMTDLGTPHERVSMRDITREEYLHTKQMEALGPAFFIAYYGSLGAPFEPYIDGTMWAPPKEQLGNCPMLRFSFSDGGASSASFMPCYEVLRFER